MAAAALWWTVTSDPRTFGSEPVCVSNYSNLDYMVLKVFSSPLFILLLCLFSIFSIQESSIDGEREMLVAFMVMADYK